MCFKRRGSSSAPIAIRIVQVITTVLLIGLSGASHDGRMRRELSQTRKRLHARVQQERLGRLANNQERGQPFTSTICSIQLELVMDHEDEAFREY